MTIVSNTQAAPPGGSGSGSGALASLPSQILTANDFIQILVAEFQNQDPTQPTDPTQFASQMVQFANLGQLQTISNAVQQSPESSLMQAASAFIGREVVAPGNSVGVSAGKATSIVYLPPATDNYTAIVTDSSGNQVDSVNLGQVAGGTLQTFSWQPPSSLGDGSYNVAIVNSSKVPVSGLLEEGTVQSVAMSSGGIVLDLGNLAVPESLVASVAQP
jgi:flagellar basal-body rod modification protein FlgD